MILLSVMMPVTRRLAGGRRSCPKIAETREIPIVFLTAGAELRDRARGFDLGAVDYIIKPFNPTSWPHASAGYWNGSSAASETSCGARSLGAAPLGRGTAGLARLRAISQR